MSDPTAFAERKIRWSVGKKNSVVQLIKNGILTSDEACSQYGLSSEELQVWMAAYETHGCHGLKVNWRKYAGSEPFSRESP